MKYFLSCAGQGGHAYVLDDHDEEGQLDAESFVGVGGAGDEVS